MKRYVCTVAAGLLLALAGTATASANDGLPIAGQTGSQLTELGNQTVGEQQNDADVTQEQGNGNVAISPAIAIGGDASTSNYQGNGNEANADVDQRNSVDQSQSSDQRQGLDSSGSCCDGQSQAGEQRVYGGDQSVGKQRNDADVAQKQGTGNIWIGPAIAIGGDAETRNYQGNGNEANADVDQKDSVDQSQSSYQKQPIARDGEACCKPTHGCKSSYGCEPKKDYGRKDWDRKKCCERGHDQTGEQKASFGDQSVDKQQNDADVAQKQGNGNVAVAPAVAFGGSQKHDACSSTCGKSKHPSYHDRGGDASTTNKQGNGNEANADVDQKTSVDQSQSSRQSQSLVETCERLLAR